MFRAFLAVLVLALPAMGAPTPLWTPTEVAASTKQAGAVPVQLNRTGLARLAPGAEVEVVLPGGDRHTYLHERFVDHGGGLVTWIARSPLSGDNDRAVITFGRDSAWGWMGTPYGEFRMKGMGRDRELVAKAEPEPASTESDVREVGADPPRIAPLKGIPTLVEGNPAAGAFATKAAPTPTVQADVMLIYTKDLAQKVGDNVMAMLHNVIATSNQAFIDSEVALVYRLVNASMIDYANGNHPDLFGSGWTLAAMDGVGGNASYFQALTWGAGSVRDVVGADFVALLRDGPNDVAGIANILRNPVTYPTSTVTQSAAYSVNNGCAGGCAGLVKHEIGHNMGNYHDPATTANQQNGSITPGGVFTYSYGYYSCANGLTCNPFTPGGCTGVSLNCLNRGANDFGDVMSYFGGVGKYSNPLQSDCVPQGGNIGAPRACGGTLPSPAPPGTVSNVALSINNVRGALSAYRNQTIVSHPGSVQFTRSDFAGGEGANVTFTASRMSGTAGQVSVSYAVTAGSATAGTDFTLASGSLTWAAGDTANKTFSVALATDSVFEGIETITATLSNPTGGTGVYLGYPATATGYVVESGALWPVGTTGALPTNPTGWTTPGSSVSSAPWAIATDSVPASDSDGRSLKSGALPFGTTNCTHPVWGWAIVCPSVVEITRSFPAGLVSFAYRVSAYPNEGWLEFLVDGVVTLAVSGDSSNSAGDTGWRYYSAALTAGTHTLSWRYRSGFGFACAYAIGPPAYPGCLDRAWIDSLTLPGVPATLPPPPPPPDPPRLANISTRARVLTGDDVMIGGFIIGGSTPKTVVVRARGPSLTQAGVLGVLANPTLQLFSGPAVIAANDNYVTAPNLSQLQSSGFLPSNVNESAILMTLSPGAYTAIVSGFAGTTGVAIVEVFEVDALTTPLINIATRGRVQTGDNVMIAGFIIQGSGSQTVVVRARGPSMAAQGVTGLLANPTMQLFSGPTVIASNDNWQAASNATAIQASGFAPSNANESAIMMTLAPGAYTAIVSGVGGTTGVAIVEVFTVP